MKSFAQVEMEQESKRLHELREILYQGIITNVDCVALNGHPENTIPGILNVSFNYVEGESLMMGMDGIAVSSGSACTSASLEPSYVLRALGIGDEAAHSSIRFSIGRFTTQTEIETSLEIIIRSVQILREMSPLYEMFQEGIDLNTVQWTPH
jgi:cysteine desulfurase